MSDNQNTLDGSSARYAVNALREIDGYLVLRAPFDGVVTKSRADVGTYVGLAANQPILKLKTTGRYDSGWQCRKCSPAGS